MFTLAEIVLKRIFYLGTKIYDDFLSAFSMNPKTTVSEINIVDIQSDTFWYTKPRTKQKRHHRQISQLGLCMVGFLFFSQTFSILNLIQETRHLVNIEAYNFFFMNLGKLQKRSGVILNPLGPVKVVVKALNRRDFPHDTTLCIHQILTFFGRITFQILHIFFQIHQFDFIQKRERQIAQLLWFKLWICLFQEIKKCL